MNVDEDAAAVLDRFYAVRYTKIDQRTGSDCLRCCLAMALCRDYDDVPDFVAEHSTRWVEPMSTWLAARGIGCVRIILSGGEGEMLHCQPMAGARLWIASGPTVRGTNHAVTFHGSEPWHDPHASRAGLVRITAALVLIPYV